MERGNRFFWKLHYGCKAKQLFEQALNCLAEVIKQTDSLSSLTDRRYSNLLFEITEPVPTPKKIDKNSHQLIPINLDGKNY